MREVESSQGPHKKYKGGGKRRWSGHKKQGGKKNFGGRKKRFGQPTGRKRSMYVHTPLTDDTSSPKKTYQGRQYTEFSLHSALLKNLRHKKFTKTTEIQEKTIPLIMQGQDIFGVSSTGSGKTAAFLIPMIQKILENSQEKLLIVAPTRELARQIRQEAFSLVKGTKLYLGLLIGGEPIRKQLSDLKRGVQIVIGTPGRIKDAYKRKALILSEYSNVIVDEVDEMLDMGFVKEVKDIFSRLGPKKQALFFSATNNQKVEQIVESLSSSFCIVKLENGAPSPNKQVVQRVVDYRHVQEKIDLLSDILAQEEVEKAIIFVETKRYADEVDKQLRALNFKVGVLHGDKRQKFRSQVLEKFRRSHIDFLVATNVAARGLDIEDITHVINLDEPQTYDEYIHRIGRTGRNGAMGTAYTFVRSRANRK